MDINPLSELQILLKSIDIFVITIQLKGEPMLNRVPMVAVYFFIRTYKWLLINLASLIVTFCSYVDLI